MEIKQVSGRECIIETEKGERWVLRDWPGGLNIRPADGDSIDFLVSPGVAIELSPRLRYDSIFLIYQFKK